MVFDSLEAGHYQAITTVVCQYYPELAGARSRHSAILKTYQSNDLAVTSEWFEIYFQFKIWHLQMFSFPGRFK